MARRYAGASTTIAAGLERRWTAEEVAEVEHRVLESMAKALWDDGVVSARENERQNGGDLDIDDIVGGDTPDAASHAAMDLRKLYGYANKIGDLKDYSSDEGILIDEDALDDLLLVANDAFEAGDYAAFVEVIKQCNAPLFVLCIRASTTLKILWPAMMSAKDQDELGYYLYMESVGHGVSWEDSHPDFERNGEANGRRVRFDSHVLGGVVDWSGRAGDLSVSGSETTPWTWDEGTDEPARVPPRIRISFETVTPNDNTDEMDVETGWDNEEGVEIEPDDLDEDDADEIAEVMRYARPAIRMLQNAGATEPSSGNWQEPPVDLWYTTADAEENYQTGERTNRSYFLDGFTRDELRAIYDTMTEDS